jgi:hypothetical protein
MPLGILQFSTLRFILLPTKRQSALIHAARHHRDRASVAASGSQKLNRRGIATASGKQWHARQVRCARHRLGI